MNLHDPSAAMAFGLGLWTAVQPCPMTANLAAVSYLGRRAGSPGSALFAALLYAAGQMIAYVILALLVLGGIASAWRLSALLQQHVNQILGPVWILTAMVLLDLIHFRLPGVTGRTEVAVEDRRLGGMERVAAGDRVGPGFLSRVGHDLLRGPLDDCRRAADRTSCIRHSTPWARRCPCSHFAAGLGAGSRWLGAALNRTQQVQRWLNRVAGGVLLAVGIYYALAFNFEVLPF